MKKPSQLMNEPDLEPKTLRDCVKNVIYSMETIKEPGVCRKGMANHDFYCYDFR